MIQLINLINNLTNDTSIIYKNSKYYLGYINIITTGSLLSLNIFYFLLYSYNYYYKQEIYVKTNMSYIIILNCIALIFVLITIIQTNYLYIFNLKPVSVPVQVPVQVKTVNSITASSKNPSSSKIVSSK